jgi:hypothetical protein
MVIYFLGSFLIVIGMGVALFIFFLLFDIESNNPLALLYLGLFAISSFVLGTLVLSKRPSA